MNVKGIQDGSSPTGSSAIAAGKTVCLRAS
jgi:hypothetical protein